MSSNELVPQIAGEMVVAALVDGAEVPEIASTEEAVKSLLSSILNAEDADSVLAVFESAPWRDLLNVPVTVTGVKWRPSTFKDGPPIFAVVDLVVKESGEIKTVSMGGRSVMAALYRLDQLNAWPQDVKLTETAKANADGNKALQLARA